MRILAIRGGNLASLKGTFAVDLARPPLCHLGLFAIAGPVGAGKSTILDAMCLALFNRTPRLSGRGGAALGRDVDGLRANDPRSLVRRGAASAFAEVEFTAKDGRVYRARWSVRRARGQAFGRLQDETVALEDAATSMRVGGDGKEETLALIEEKLGLSFDEFCRSVLLAQGGFSSFLKAKADERAALLEKITGTGIYSLLSMRAFERARDEQAKKKQLEDELAAMPPAKSEERAIFEENVRVAAETRARAAKLVDDAEARLRHDERDRELVASVVEAEIAAGIVHAKRNESHDAAAVLALEKAWPLRPLIHAAERAKIALASAEDACRRAIDDDKRAKNALEGARERRSRAEDAFAANARMSAEAEPQLARAVVLDEQIARAGAAEAERARIEAEREKNEIEHELESLQSSRAVAAADLHRANEVLAREPELVALLPAWPALAADIAALSHADTELEGARAIANSAATNLDEANAKLNVAKARVASAAAKLAEAHTKLSSTNLDEVARTLAEAAAENARAKTLHESRERIEHRLEKLRASLKTAEAALADAESKRALSTETVAEALRRRLAPGDPCPVCGATEHAIAPHDAHDDAISTHEAIDLLEAEAQRAAAAARVDEIRGALHLAETDLARTEAAPRPTLDDAEIEAQRNVLSEARRIADELRACEDEARDAEAEHDVAAQALALHQRVVEDRARNREERAQSIRSRLPLNADLVSPRELVRNLKPRLDGLRTQQTAAAAATAALAQTEPHLRALQQRLAAALERLARRTQEAESARTQDASLRTERAALLDGESVASVRTRLAVALDDARCAAGDAQAALAAADVRALEAARRKNDATAALDVAREQRRTAEDALIGIDRDSAERAARLPDDALDNARESVREIERDIARAEAVLAERRASLSTHRENTPAAIPVALDDAKRALDDASETWANARAVVAADDAARTRHATLVPAVDAQRERALTWQKLSDLIGSADGARFRVFAQSLTLDALLTNANAQLALLAPRYRLERAKGAPSSSRFDLDLVVIDRETGDEPRAVSSLSGGETFLVSLALALGLSALSSSKSSVESLFIDEGFSSLDPETLEAALAALEALRATGRQIGVISHVPALVERIGAQVRVVPLGGGRSRVDISQAG